MYDSTRYESEVGAPMQAVEHVDDRQPMDRGLSIGSQLHRTWTAPTFVHRDIRQPPRSELPYGGPPVDMVDRLEVDVHRKIEMPLKTGERVATLLGRQGSGQNV